MARSLFWKEKVALISLLFLFAFSSGAQTSSSQNITYTCHATRLETVISFLSGHTGYNFIYSKSIVDISKPVSLAVKNKSINEVLALIEKQADVSFKMHDRHIVIKNNPRPVTIAVPQQGERQLANIQPAFDADDSLLVTSTERIIPSRIFDSQATELENHLNRRIVELQQLLGVSTPHNIPKYFMNRINMNNRYNGWYAGIGTYVSDNASGLEFQGGLRYLYGVFTPRWSAEHGFYGGYGIGTMLPIGDHFSINAIYMYSGYTDSQIVHHNRMGFYGGPDTRETEIRRQHQVKLALRYSFNENLSLRTGPVLNYSTTINQTSFVPSVNTTYQIIENQPGYSRLRQKWVGWEVALQYRINFYKKDH